MCTVLETVEDTQGCTKSKNFNVLIANVLHCPAAGVFQRMELREAREGR